LSITAVAPNLFSEISMITSLIGVVGLTAGFSFFSIRSRTLKYNFFPKAPPGWYLAKSVLSKLFKSNKQTA